MRLQDIRSEIAASATTAGLWEALRHCFLGTGVRKIVYLHLPPLGAPDSGAPELLAEGVPEALAERYLSERLYRDNPILKRAHRLVHPVYWDEVDPERMDPQELQFFLELREAGFERGVGLPVFGPDGRRGQFGLGFEGDLRRLEPEVLTEYWQICVLAHLRFCALVLPTLAAPVRLSRRETEVLGWVARGKSSALIGSILGISAATVDAHLRRIYLKLGVFDRISAAVRGIGTGLIHADV